ncbi:bifunctional diaminohydroxyphosphoribosylaminopyrimidine deaminase/5-amino-6-(5-phosphoribosylamino)uracil reductase RibD [Candidatus Acetothermia bacterium]|nr:bifunctional diaminohydroxyphosphoribosylaminopyrimidine deaminase/5-amino-6-(5-phosphoribosylamino)uracil reductase RibD [Candidatus Acetothermia bacterium]
MTPEQWMRRALKLAAHGRGWVNPNPLVGAVLIKDGKLISEGFHQRYGGPHAEAVVLEKAGSEARGADLYANVEPCVSHPGKRTPPCADQIIQSGVRRVFVAMRDPDTHVNGRGIAQLRAAGIDVQESILAAEAQKLNEISVKYKTTGKPFVLLKMAMSADGKIATRTGHSKYISSPDSLHFAHELRDRYAALLVGIRTVLADDPQLNTRLDRPGHNPVRVILDAHGRLPLEAKLLRMKSSAKTILATTDALSKAKEEALSRLGIEIWKLPTSTVGAQHVASPPTQQIDLHALVDRLGKTGLDSLLVEGGSMVAASFLQAKLIDKTTFVIAPLLIGGQSAPSPIGGQGIEKIENSFRLKDISLRALGQDIVYEAYLDYTDPEESE